MTKSLTEKRKDGTLNGGIYYLLLRDGTTVTDKTIYIVGEKQLRWHFSSFDFVKEVLAPVPSYDEYKELKEERDYFQKTMFERNAYINKLQEQLNTATKALKGISVWENTGNGGEQAVKNLCEKALKEMGVK